MSQLALLHSRLAWLRRRRQLGRWGIGWSALGLAVLWVLAGAFLADWILQMSRLQRVVLLGIVVAATVWAFRRYTLPFLGWKEDEVDLALLVERHHGIDSDLVAALQFQTAGAAAWGSPQLETAVIEYVEDFSPSLNVSEGFTNDQLRRRTTALGVTAAIALAAVLLFPGHAAAFFNRLLLGSAHYPTRTQINAIRINGQPVGEDVVRSPYGRALLFEVDASGELPADGRVTLRSTQNGTQADVPLTKGADAQGKTAYRGELPRLVDSVGWQLYLGDAWTDPREITVIPLPAVNVELTPVPPEYARAGREADSTSDGNLQTAVLEGSEVRLRVVCTNKDLQRATAKIGDYEYELQRADKQGRAWTLAGDDHPLARITEPVRYSVQVEDADGLALEQPIQGYIRIKADRPPRVTRWALPGRHKRVLPNARLSVAYGAADDYGLAGLTLHVEIRRKEGDPSEQTLTVQSFDAADRQTETEGVYALDLEPLSLEKNDEITLTLHAEDHRGHDAPQAGRSEPIVLQVTDAQGILAGMLESDEKSAEQLDATIRIELGIGDAK